MSGLVSTQDNTLRRKSALTAGDTNGADAFDPSAEWDGFALDTFDGLGTDTVAEPIPEPASLLLLGSGLLLAGGGVSGRGPGDTPELTGPAAAGGGPSSSRHGRWR